MPDSKSLASPTQVYTSPYGRFSFLQNKKVLTLVAAIVLLVVGFAGGYYYQTKISPVTTPTVRVPLSILANPLVTSYWGTVSGNITNVNTSNRSIVVSGGKSEMTLTVGPNPLTHIYDTSARPMAVEINFADLKVGENIDATVTFPMTSGSTTGVPGAITARSINVTKK